MMYDPIVSTPEVDHITPISDTIDTTTTYEWLPDSVVSFVIEREGNAYVNDTDIGEESRMGITNHTYKAYYGKVNSYSIINLKKHEAVAIYKSMFWDKYNLDSIVSLGYVSTSVVLMDSQVNLGPYRATRMLQEVLGMNRHDRSGYIDQATLECLAESNISDSLLSSLLLSRRKRYYGSLVKARPVFARYESGWYNRLDSIEVFISML